METLNFKPGLFNPNFRFKPTYKGWKHRRKAENRRNIRSVLSLPTRDGNAFTPKFVSKASKGVLSLPTRDGNQIFPPYTYFQYRSFKPTYKGWKLFFPEIFPNLVIHVLSLPTRDGNCFDFVPKVPQLPPF